MKLNIQQKIQFFIISASIVIYIIAVGYISYNSRKMAFVDAKEITNRFTHETANDIKDKLDADMTIITTLSSAFHTYKNLPKEKWQNLFSKMLNEAFVKNPQVYSLWYSWELNEIDPNWDKPTGRYVLINWREHGIVKSNEELRSLDGDHPMYADIKNNKRSPFIIEPYEDVYGTNKAEKYMMTSLSAPIIEDNKFVGLVVADITLDRFQTLVEEIKPFNGSYAFMLSNEGTIAGHPNKEYLGEKIEELFPEDLVEFKITEKILKGKSFNYISTDENGIKNYISFAPIMVKDTDTPWSIAISVPVETIMVKAKQNLKISLLVGIFGIILMALVIAIIGRNITNPLKRITQMLNQLAKGRLDREMKVTIATGDEIEEMSNALNNSIDGLNAKVNFANLIGQGELNSNLNLLSEKDVLGKSLIEMQNSLKKAENEESNRKSEDKRRKWSNEGLANFADILRQNNDNIETLTTEVIIHLVNYLNADQGGIFILNDNEKEDIRFDLIASFAFDRKKFLKKSIRNGEGLIGTSAIEKKTTFMTALPPNYLEITSGLGGAKPKSLVIVPLVLEDTVLGLIEIGSFNVLEKFEIQFVEKLAESIASTLSSVKISIKTAELLERSQQQAEEMAAQEEEMRQNMEELQATQEESSRKGAEMEGLVVALNTSSFVIEYDTEGIIQKVNDNYLELLELSRDKVIGTHHSGNITFTEQQKIEYDKFWRKLKNGEVVKEITKININKNNFVFEETYTPIRNSEGEVYKILKISNNITDFHQRK